MERQRRITALVVLITFVLAQLPAQDWQGMAGRSATVDFPGSGLYAASNTFATNTLVEITNPATGKTVRVIVTTSLGKSSLLLALSPQAADALGLQAGQTMTVRAAQVALPSALGSSYAEESLYNRDPDRFGVVAAETPATSSPVETAGPVVPTTPVVPVTPVVPATPVTPTSPVNPAGPAVATGPVIPMPPVTPTSPVATVSPPVTPQVRETDPRSETLPGREPAPASPRTPVGPAMPRPDVRPAPAATAPATPARPRQWVGLRSGIDEAARTGLEAGQVGGLSSPAPAPVTPAVGPASPASTGRGTGLAQGLGIYGRSRDLLSPGDVSRPEQSIWLSRAALAASSKSDSRLRPPAVAADPDRNGPESLAISRPGQVDTTLRPGILASPALRDRPAVAANPSTPATPASEALPYETGPGLYGRQLADARGRSLANLAGQGTLAVDDPESLTGPRANPRGLGELASLPSARLAEADRPDAPVPDLRGSNPVVSTGDLPTARLADADRPDTLVPDLRGPSPVMVAGALPEALVARDSRAEAGLPGAKSSVTGLVTDLPVASVPNPENAESGLSLRPDTPTYVATLPETRPKDTEVPETPVPRGYADSVLLSFEPADYRPPTLPASDSADPALAGTNPGSSAVGGDLAEARLPNSENADPALAGANPAATDANGQPLRDPAATSADPALAGTNPGSSTVGGDLAEARLPGSESADPALASANPGAVDANGHPLRDPAATSADPALAGTSPGSSGTVIAGDLANPRPTTGSNADPALAGANPGTADGTSAALAAPATGPDGSTAGPVAPDPRSASVLAYLEPAPARPPVAGTTTPVVTVDKPATDKPVTDKPVADKPAVDKPVADKPMADKPVVITGPGKDVPVSVTAGFRDADWARANLPLAAGFQKSRYYIQAGSFADPKAAAAAIKKFAPGYPVVVVAETFGGRGLYKVFAGPLRDDEKGLVLTWFRSKGYKDAFVRLGTSD